MYGPVRTVVWQGSAGDRGPYADQTGMWEITPERSASVYELLFIIDVYRPNRPNWPRPEHREGITPDSSK